MGHLRPGMGAGLVPEPVCAFLGSPFLGGAVNGARTFGKLPDFTINGPDDTGTGRWIPTLAVDQYSATLAKWFGVDNTSMSAVFPNISRFATADLGFML